MVLEDLLTVEGRTMGDGVMDHRVRMNISDGVPSINNCEFIFLSIRSYHHHETSGI
jgi:hypothetical protein